MEDYSANGLIQKCDAQELSLILRGMERKFTSEKARFFYISRGGWMESAKEIGAIYRRLTSFQSQIINTFRHELRSKTFAKTPRMNATSMQMIC
eukprot:CFRG3139T1